VRNWFQKPCFFTNATCTAYVTFGAFREYLSATYPPDRFDRIASGHYAAMDRAENKADPSKQCKLVMSGDAHKDQTYFLAHLSQVGRVVTPGGCQVGYMYYLGPYRLSSVGFFTAWLPLPGVRLVTWTYMDHTLAVIN
jgi:hypothetical protein